MYRVLPGTVRTWGFKCDENIPGRGGTGAGLDNSARGVVWVVRVESCAAVYPWARVVMPEAARTGWIQGASGGRANRKG